MRRKGEQLEQAAVRSAFTKVELLAVLAVLALAFALTVPALARAKAKANRISCNGRLKNVGLSFRIYAMDNRGAFPWLISTNLPGSANLPWPGTREFAASAQDLWRHFAVVSNELATPLIVACPADEERRPVRSWNAFTNNSSLSYFLGLSTAEEHPQSILAGDRNIRLDGRPLSNEIVAFGARTNVVFDQRVHNDCGNVLMGDGSVQMPSSARLQSLFLDAYAAMGTNTLAFP